MRHIFYTNQIHGGSSGNCSLFILSLHALALHLTVKILLQIFLYEDLPGVGLTYICRLYFPPECQQDRTLFCSNTIKWKHSRNIWHKSTSAKHKEVRPDWNDKNDITKPRAPRIPHGKVLPMAQVAILKKYSIKCERFRLWIVLFWTKTSQRLTLYLLSSHR